MNCMKVRVGVIHSNHLSPSDTKLEFDKYMPDVEVVNIVDDALLADILKYLQATPTIIRHLAQYYRHCEELGCVCILNHCTSLSIAADAAEKVVDIPVFRLDYPMALKAAKIGGKIGLVATAPSTLDPSRHNFEKAITEVGSDAELEVYFCEGAHPALFKDGNTELHDRIVKETVLQAAETCSVIALAQGSMRRVLPLLSDVKVPILTSVEEGVLQVKNYLVEQGYI